MPLIMTSQFRSETVSTSHVDFRSRNPAGSALHSGAGHSLPLPADRQPDQHRADGDRLHHQRGDRLPARTAANIYGHFTRPGPARLLLQRALLQAMDPSEHVRLRHSSRLLCVQTEEARDRPTKANGQHSLLENLEPDLHERRLPVRMDRLHFHAGLGDLLVQRLD